ncbi:MAG: hypothetical protein IPJ88_04755 [Myxococcales bacterium]|nr:MAG: hypothetical protein IPJ88_04755 [Myxococcales bacterium]
MQNGLQCIPMVHKGDDHGAYCLKSEDGNCSRPYGFGIIRQTITDDSSVEGQQYCGINESKTTCEAVLKANDPCSSATECGSVPGDAVCDTVGITGPLCSYPCADDFECTGTLGCNGYCGAP